jgi:hypothetical protein
MAILTVELAVWLLGLAALIMAAIIPLSRLIRQDSMKYDEAYVWHCKLEELPPDDKKIR